MGNVQLSKYDLHNKIDFTSFNKEVRTNLKNYEPVILLPGLLIGVHNSFFEYVNFVCECWGVNSIRVVIHSWDYRLNNSWIAKFKDVCKDNPKINLELITESYNEPKFHFFLNKLKVNLGGEENGFIDSQFLKRFVIYYSMMRAYETFLANSPKETYIIKLRSCYFFNSDYRPDIFEFIWQAKTFIGPDSLREKYLFTDDLDILFSPVNAPDRLSESIFFTSLNTFRNILGSSLDELVDKLTSVMLSLQYRLDNQEDIKEMDFETKMNNFAVFPYSGAIIFRKLVTQFNELLITSEGCIRTIDLNMKWENPIINIHNNKLHVYKDDKSLRVHKYKLKEYIINYRPKTIV